MLLPVLGDNTQQHKLSCGKVFFLNRTLDWYKDKLSITTVIFIMSENNLALLQLYVLLGTSECMLWIQSMHSEVPMVIGDWLSAVIVWAILLLSGCDRHWEEHILRPGVLKITLSHKWLRLYLPTFLFNVGLLIPNVDSLPYGPGLVPVLPSYDAKIVGSSIMPCL